MVAARRWGATIVDPRPYAGGSLAEVLARWPHLDPLLPAMGYGDRQVRELEAALNDAPADLVLSATPIDLTRVMRLNKPVVRVRYDLAENDPPALRRKIQHVLDRRAVAAPAGVGGAAGEV
jgi:predicted GTPase